MNLQDTIYSFNTVSFSDFEDISFKNSVETKYILNSKKLNKLLNQVKHKYYILSVNDKRIHENTNKYYDTEDLKIYHDYHNGKRNRYLIRNFEKERQNNNYLEIKFHSNSGKVIKYKKKSVSMDIINPNNKSFIEQYSPYNPDNLMLMLKNQYSRIVLIHKSKKEKVSIDINLQYTDKSNKLNLSNIAIIEVKQDKLFINSEFISALRKKNIHKTSLSKYCIGIALLNDNVKKNKFKQNLLAIYKINKDDNNIKHNIRA
ncbi:MAG: hypothetical protein JXR51_11175 [Bacteroidales bacterium]|nr:hypothetical protein [Bacteroidales bacterium]MBN2757731.1 hypothetical protein [Bacteroidales bacterium]